MFAFDQRSRRWTTTLLLTSIAAGCDDPLRPRPTATMLDLTAFAILDPSATGQPLMILQGRGQEFVDLRVVVEESDTAVVSTDFPAPSSEDYSLQPCIERYTIDDAYGRLRCVNLQFAPAYGKTYDVTITAPGRPTARATTTVPGDFSIVAWETLGLAPGAVQLRLGWTRAVGTYRYVVTVAGLPDFSAKPCYPDPDVSCNERWMLVTEDTTIAVEIPAWAFKESTGPYSIDVYAMDKGAYGSLMTGTASTLFPIPPAQNVTGGHGAIGAWVKRRIPLDP